MPSPESNPLEHLTRLADQADASHKEAASSGNFAAADRALDALEAELVSAERTLNPFEGTLHLSAQYERQTKLLEKLGIPQTLEGAPCPTLDQVRDRLFNHRELLERKIEQGFTQLLIVPFGMSIEDLRQKYGEQLKLHKAAGTLFAEGDQATELKLDDANPVYKWDGYDNQEIVYFPTAFDQQNHGGLSKADAVAREGAWQVYLVEETPIPRQTKGISQGGRKQLEAKLTPRQYLEKLKTDPQYAAEVGLTPELWLMKALTRLEEKNEVTDDYHYQDKGSFNYNLGAYFPSSSYVGSAGWYRGSSQANLGGIGAYHRDESVGSSSAVRV